MRRGGGGSRIGRVLLLLAGTGLILLIAAQVLLPGIAASRISSRVSRYGTVGSVEVKAWPAVQLLWGSADSVTVRAKALRLGPAEAAALLWEGREVDRMELSAASVQVGPMQLRDVRLQKRGSSLTAAGRIGEAEVRAALPAGFEVQLLGSEGGSVEVRASGGLFGVGAAVRAVAAASEGRLVVHPLGSGMERLRLTLFSDAHVQVTGVGASLQPGMPASYRLSMSARLR